MILRRWEELPDSMRTEAVRPYYEILSKRKASLVFKRLFDLLLSALLIVLLSPVILLIALFVALDSRGGVFFRQERVTTYCKPFRIFKFRTMIPNDGKSGPLVTLPGDARVTRAGRFLRKAKLDELPQLFNIFTGDMSFMGTRPEVPKYVARYTDEMMATLLLPAGITSEGSIFSIGEHELMAGATNLDDAYVEKVLPEKMRYNLHALKYFTFASDLRTMARTVLAVVGAPIRADVFGGE